MSVKFTMSIESSGAALTDDPVGEVGRLLEAARDNLGENNFGALLDTDGNTVGRWSLEVDDA